MTDALEGCPDWNFWGQMQEVKLCEAVALSLNLNPDALEWDRFDRKFEAGEDFDRRLRVSESHASNGSLRLLAYCSTTHNSPVILRVFAAWASGVWQDLPEQLLAIARDSAPMGTPKQVNTPAIASVKRDDTGLLALTTGDIAFCFDGLRWSEQEWKKPLGDKPKWLRACVHTPGQRGVFETRWNPVYIGAALVRDGHAPAKSVRARFQTKDLLKPWLDTWKTYEADNLNTE